MGTAKCVHLRLSGMFWLRDDDKHYDDDDDDGAVDDDDDEDEDINADDVDAQGGVKRDRAVSRRGNAANAENDDDDYNVNDDDDYDHWTTSLMTTLTHREASSVI